MLVELRNVLAEVSGRCQVKNTEKFLRDAKIHQRAAALEGRPLRPPNASMHSPAIHPVASASSAAATASMFWAR